MLIVVYLLIINVISFALYGIDKRKAIKKQRRIPERTLLALAILGGFFGALLGMFIFHHKTRKKKFTITVPAVSVLWIGILGICLYQNYHLVVSEYTYAADFDCRVVQVSDLHNQIFGFRQRALLRKIEACDPDLIVVTGDALDSIHTNYGATVAFFEGAVAIAPVYYVTGNHEVWLYGEHFDEFLAQVEALGVHFIDGKVEGADDMLIAGTSDDSHTEDYAWEEDGRLHVLLAHDPNRIEEYRQAGADVVFAGHVHGGQIRIPGKGGLLSPDFTWFPPYCEGEYQVGATTMYVSRGLGNSLLPVRINNYPEIVVVEFSTTGV